MTQPSETRHTRVPGQQECVIGCEGCASDREEWYALIEQVNELHGRLQKKPAHLKLGYRLCSGGILNAYREGDISFDDAVTNLDALRTPATQGGQPPVDQARLIEEMHGALIIARDELHECSLGARYKKHPRDLEVVEAAELRVIQVLEMVTEFLRAPLLTAEQDSGEAQAEVAYEGTFICYPCMGSDTPGIEDGNHSRCDKNGCACNHSSHKSRDPAALPQAIARKILENCAWKFIQPQVFNALAPQAVIDQQIHNAAEIVATALAPLVAERDALDDKLDAEIALRIAAEAELATLRAARQGKEA